jgi:outer membrane protein with beta-barrel domain
VLSRTAVMATALALAASASWAQDPRFEIGANAGWTLSDGVTGGPILAGDGNLYNSIDPDDSFSWGADIGFFINENTSIGALFSQQSSKMLLGGSTEREVGDWSVQNYHGVVTYHFGDLDATARPYVFGGAGMTHYGSVDFVGVGGERRSTGGESQFSTTWGAGVKVYPSPKVGLKLGVRWTPTYIKSDADGWWCDPYWGCYVVGDAQYSNQFEFSGGLSLRF